MSQPTSKPTYIESSSSDFSNKSSIGRDGTKVYYIPEKTTMMKIVIYIIWLKVIIIGQTFLIYTFADPPIGFTLFLIMIIYAWIAIGLNNYNGNLRYVYIGMSALELLFLLIYFHYSYLPHIIIGILLLVTAYTLLIDNETVRKFDITR